MKLLIVAAGGALGTGLRYAMSGWVYRVTPMAAFPWGTLVVNVLGCLLIGLFAGLAEQRQVLGPMTRLFLLIGVLGGFTTFSTFAYETYGLGRDQESVRALGNITLHVVLGLVGVWAGYVLSRLIGGKV
ncbi:MAG: fluoride efflux transporter CrcB [Planctomycetes bacterium]|nr:fluoride efflux transporter CrcB [Planctomycetota bacterium]